ncbi:hypothetical protein DVH24_031251 [Malus domestica]|uniref:Uncharacterized protein n=1 Tax=Malus domestica TaxID=3750 RepID=A0A498HBS7_MALDO|nr:hypothetical protein DVH24_031251 [Malus domestica]
MTSSRVYLYCCKIFQVPKNQLRGFVISVVWSDVPGIITEKKEIFRELEALKASYEEQREAANQAS